MNTKQIDDEQYKSLIKDSCLQNQPYYEFLYLREMEL